MLCNHLPQCSMLQGRSNYNSFRIDFAAHIATSNLFQEVSSTGLACAHHDMCRLRCALACNYASTPSELIMRRSETSHFVSPETVSSLVLSRVLLIVRYLLHLLPEPLFRLCLIEVLLALSSVLHRDVFIIQILQQSLVHILLNTHTHRCITSSSSPGADPLRDFIIQAMLHSCKGKDGSDEMQWGAAKPPLCISGPQDVSWSKQG